MSLERIDIEGTFNFRDIGGTPTSAGDWRVRTGRVFRADGMAQLTARARADLSELGVRTVIDLRDIGERSKLPDALDGLDVEYLALPIFADHFFPSRPMSRKEMEAAAEATGMDLTDRSLERIYDLMITHFGPRLAQAVDAIAQRDAEGIVFHCSAGKDRTGVVATFLLDLLGVGRADIVDEYAITSHYLSGEFLDSITRNFADAGISGNLAETATASPPELITEVLDRLGKEYPSSAASGSGAAAGAVEAYLLEHGMDPATPERLRAALLTGES